MFYCCLLSGSGGNKTEQEIRISQSISHDLYINVMLALLFSFVFQVDLCQLTILASYASVSYTHLTLPTKRIV